MLQYHSKDKYATPATEARVQEYKVRGFPALMFNGRNAVMGGFSGSYKDQTKAIDKELAKEAAVTLTLSVLEGVNMPTMALVTNVSGAAITNARLMAVVYEDLGTDEHHYVVREILEPVVFDLAANSSQDYSFKPNFTGDEQYMVTFVQAASGEVLQAASTG